MKSMRTKGIILSAVGSILWEAQALPDNIYYPMRRSMRNGSHSFAFYGRVYFTLWHAITGGALFALWKNKKDAMSIFWFGAVGMVMTQYMYFVTIKHSNAATATVIQYLMPIFIIGWICFIQNDYLKRKKYFVLYAQSWERLLLRHMDILIA